MIKTMFFCRLCQFQKVDLLLNLDDQPLCNRFLTNLNAEEAIFPFSLGQCLTCGMIQIITPVPPYELKPRFDWISYREAEGHLDQLVDEIVQLPGVNTTSVVGGVSFKDDSTIERFQKLGFANTWRIEIQDDQTIRPQKKADILIVRHIVEHAQNTAHFIDILQNLIQPNGYLIIEVPDCGPALQRGDYTMPWEEHILYFTEDLLRQAVACWRLSSVSYRLYPYSHENSLVAILHGKKKTTSQALDPFIAETTRSLGNNYAYQFDGYRRVTNETLSKFRKEKGKIAVFGAGHLSCVWINFLNIRAHIDFIVDDDPRKAGLLMPGSHLPILPSSQLIKREIKLCLLSLNQESEAKVVGKNQDFLFGGGTFSSIFPGRSNSFVV